MNNTTHKHISQDTNNSFNKNNSYFTKSDSPTPWNLLDPWPNLLTAIGTILAMTPGQKRVLNTLVTLSFRYPQVFASQEKIAKMSKLHRVTVNRILKELERLGYIAIENNGAHKTCWYKISKFFYKASINELLKSALPFFFYLSVKLLSISNFSEATLCIKDFNLLKTNSNRLSTTKPVANYISTAISTYRYKRDAMNFGSEAEINPRLLESGYNFTPTELKQFSAYSDEILQRSLYKLNNSTKIISNPAGYLHWLIKNDASLSTQKQLAAKPAAFLKKIATAKPTVQAIKPLAPSILVSQPPRETLKADHEGTLTNKKYDTFTATELMNHIYKIKLLKYNPNVGISEIELQFYKYGSMAKALCYYPPGDSTELSQSAVMQLETERANLLLEVPPFVDAHFAHITNGHRDTNNLEQLLNDLAQISRITHEKKYRSNIPLPLTEDQPYKRDIQP